VKEEKLNAEVTKDAKPCPRCHYLIEKNGGCNHMKCAKCKASFCWLCMKEVEDEPLPAHYKEGGACEGKQFEGDDVQIPAWAAVFLCCFGCIFGLPALAIALPLSIICCPFAICCDRMLEENPGDRTCDFPTVFGGCWMFWLGVFFFFVVALPVGIITRLVQFIFGICGIDPCESCARAANQARDDIDAIEGVNPDVADVDPNVRAMARAAVGAQYDQMSSDERRELEHALATSMAEALASSSSAPQVTADSALGETM
jgi:hypothetical protein